MDSNFLTMIGVLGGTLIVSMVLLYLSLKTGGPPRSRIATNGGDKSLRTPFAEVSRCALTTEAHRNPENPSLLKS
jgi:hypothetical protein